MLNRADAVSTTVISYRAVTPYPTHALGTVELIAFMTAHSVDPFLSDAFHLRTGEEELLSTDPLEARYTFTADGDAIALTMDEDLSVVDATRHEASGSHC